MLTGKELVQWGFKPGKWFAEAIEVAQRMDAEGQSHDAIFTHLQRYYGANSPNMRPYVSKAPSRVSGVADMTTPQWAAYPSLFRPLIFWWLGRRIMMDFGFGSFLDKFEVRFGQRPTTALLLLVGLSVSAFCVNLIATYAVIPIVDMVEAAAASDQLSYKALKTLQIFSIILLFVLIFAGFRTGLEAHRSRTKAMEMLDQYSVFRDFAINFWDNTGGLQAELHTIFLDIEFARSKKQRDAAVRRAREILDANREQYSERVTAFNRAVSQSPPVDGE